MKYIFILFLSVWAVFPSVAQQKLRATYLVEIPEARYKRIDTLYIVNKQSCYIIAENDTTVRFPDGGAVQFRPREEHIFEDMASGTGIYRKKLDKKTIIFNRFEVKKREWEILNEFKEINGYKCQKAISAEKDKTKFRSDPVAWFCPDLPINGGPSGFGVWSLPGLVVRLEFEKTTGTYYQLISLTFEKVPDQIRPSLKQAVEVPLNEYMRPELISKKWLENAKKELN
jgi:GLPGLI family protein